MDIASFIRLPLSGDITTIPGMNSVNKEKFLKNDIVSTYHLIGKFIMFCDTEIDPKVTFHRFYKFLNDLEIENSKIITLAIAEKVGTWISGSFDPDIQM